METKINIIIDFDSTFVQIEALAKLAEIALEKVPNKERIIKKINYITKMGMDGQLPFSQSLATRLKLFQASKKDIVKLVNLLKKRITPSFIRNRKFFKKHRDQIYIISGGFVDYIWPVVKPFGIKKKNILTNKFIFNKELIIGFDQKNLLFQDKGKAKQIQTLNLKGKIFVIGDGYTDYEIKEMGLADKFFAFCENVRRQTIVKRADYVINSFDEFVIFFYGKIVA